MNLFFKDMNIERMRSTTVIAIEHKGAIAIGADGQATLGHTVVKDSVRKLRILADGRVKVGFAGSTADSLALLSLLEEKLNAKGNLYRAALDLAKEWRTDRYLRKLESMMVVVDRQQILIITGNGDVMRPDDGIASVGSGSAYARSAALALKEYAPHMTAREMVQSALGIAAKICIYTNDHIMIEDFSEEKT